MFCPNSNLMEWSVLWITLQPTTRGSHSLWPKVLLKSFLIEQLAWWLWAARQLNQTLSMDVIMEVKTPKRSRHQAWRQPDFNNSITSFYKEEACDYMGQSHQVKRCLYWRTVLRTIWWNACVINIIGLIFPAVLFHKLTFWPTFYFADCCKSRQENLPGWVLYDIQTRTAIKELLWLKILPGSLTSTKLHGLGY